MNRKIKIVSWVKSKSIGITFYGGWIAAPRNYEKANWRLANLKIKRATVKSLMRVGRTKIKIVRRAVEKVISRYVKIVVKITRHRTY